MASTYWLAPGNGTDTGLSASHPTSILDYKNRIHGTLNPDDAVNGLAGNYDATTIFESDTNAKHTGLKFSRSGTSGHPIIFQSVNSDGSPNPGGAVLMGPALGSYLVNGQASTNLPIGLDVRASWINILGWKVFGMPFNGIVISSNSPTNVIVRNCFVEWCSQSVSGADGVSTNVIGGQGILIGGTASDITIDGCNVYQCKEHGIYPSNGATRITLSSNVIRYNGRGYTNYPAIGNAVPPGTPGAADGQVNIASYLTITGNRIYGGSRWGLLCLAMTNSLIKNNFIYANAHRGISLASGSHDNTIDGNQVASDTRECLNIDDSAQLSVRNSIINNILFAKNYPWPCIPISYGFQAASIGIPNISYPGVGLIASGGNVFRKGGGSYTVAKTNPSQSDVTFAAYQAAFSDNTSVESTATGLSLGLDNDILIWLGEPPPPSDLYSHVLASASGGPGLLNEGVPVGGRA